MDEPVFLNVAMDEMRKQTEYFASMVKKHNDIVDEALDELNRKKAERATDAAWERFVP